MSSSIVKSLVFAVFFVVQVADANFYVNCMAAPDALPDALECTEEVREDVLAMLHDCTGLTMDYAGQEEARRRRLGSGQEELSSTTKRDLWWGNSCWSTNLGAIERMLCCMPWLTGSSNAYSYCGSPMNGNDDDDRRGLQEEDYDAMSMSAIAAQCTEDFKALANEHDPCFGNPDEVFCETIQVSIG
jgi:hypothetical protein